MTFRHNAFTLMEVLVAMAVISIALVAVLKASFLIQDNLMQADYLRRANSLALNLNSRLQAFGLQKLKDMPDSDSLFPELQWKIETTETGIEDLFKVKIIVNTLSGLDSPVGIESFILEKEE